MEFAGLAVNVEQATALEDADGGRDTLRQVFDETIDSLYRFLLVRLGGDRDAADELLQQTCYEAVRNGRSPADTSECEAWLRGIARNLLRRHWRKSQRQAGRVTLEDAELAGRLVDDLESRPLPTDALIKEESIAQLLLAITSLSAADQGLLFAHYFDGRPQAALACDLGVTPKSIESRLYRARCRLRAALRGMVRSGER